MADRGQSCLQGKPLLHRVHCSLNINTETGRLSARRPNLQNQPALEKDRYKVSPIPCMCQPSWAHSFPRSSKPCRAPNMPAVCASNEIY